MQQYSKYTNEYLNRLIEESEGISEVLRKLGRNISGGNVTHLKKLLLKRGLYPEKFQDSRRRRRHYGGGTAKRSPEEVLVLSDRDLREKGSLLTRCLVASGVTYKCKCGCSGEWEGQKITLHVDHINGDWKDNRKENLRFLCPNCHSQTKTFGFKKR